MYYILFYDTVDNYVGSGSPTVRSTWPTPPPCTSGVS